VPKIGNNWQQLATIDRFSNNFGYFHVFGPFLPILAIFYEVKITF
jgi:hypothetical protein